MYGVEQKWTCRFIPELLQLQGGHHFCGSRGDDTLDSSQSTDNPRTDFLLMPAVPVSGLFIKAASFH